MGEKEFRAQSVVIVISQNFELDLIKNKYTCFNHHLINQAIKYLLKLMNVLMSWLMICSVVHEVFVA